MSGDVAELASIAAAGRARLPDQRGGDHWLRREALDEPLTDTIASFVDRSDAAAFVAEIDTVPLGLLLIEESDDRGGRVGVVRELYVLPDARGVGLGEHMMNLAVDWAREHGCESVDSMALPGDRATKNFFETFGLKARAIVVNRRLNEPESP